MPKGSRKAKVEPWMIAAALAAVGIAGATGVWLSAKAIRANDRAAVREWEARAALTLERAAALHRDLRDASKAASDGKARADGLAALHRAFDDVRAGFDDLPRPPDVLMSAVTEYRHAVTAMGAALAALDRLAAGDAAARASFEDALDKAEAHRREANARRERLRARLGL